MIIRRIATIELPISISIVAARRTKPTTRVWGLKSPGYLQQSLRDIQKSYGKLVENRFPSRRQRIWMTWRPEYKHGGTPPPGMTHWPAI